MPPHSVPLSLLGAGNERLAVLEKLAMPLARKNKLTLRTYNPSKDKLADQFDYIVLMAPVPMLAAHAIHAAAPRGIINIFAGIPADKTAELDLDSYIEKQLYFIGTSGSVLEDMKQVLAKVVSRRLDTNLSVAAVSGLDGAIEGIRAVEKNLMTGKIIVYPSCRGNVEVRIPEDCLGKVMGDISSRRGRILGIDTEGHFQVIRAEVPARRSVQSLSSVLRSLTSAAACTASGWIIIPRCPANWSNESSKKPRSARPKGRRK